MPQQYFLMYDDINGDPTITNSWKKGPNVVIQTHTSFLLNHCQHIIGGNIVVSMKAPVELARHVYVTTLFQHFVLIDYDGNDTASIMHTVVHGAILNPLIGKYHQFSDTSNLL